MDTQYSHPNGGRYWLAGMGLFLAFAGAVFTFGLWWAWQKSEQTRHWTPVPCRILHSKIASEKPTPNSNPVYRVELQYEFTYEGKVMKGDHIQRVDKDTVHEETARDRLLAYPAGLETTCYVNPTNPEETVLQHGTRAALYSIWFPMLFVAGGLKMAWDAMKRGKRKKGT